MRIKIEKPNAVHFTCNMVLRVDDMNYGNHMGNERILVLAHEARVQFLKSFGCSEFDIFGSSIIQADAAISYKSEGHQADLIECQISVVNIGNSSFDLIYQFNNLTTQKELAICKTGMVFYDYSNQKVNSCPEKFKLKFIT